MFDKEERDQRLVGAREKREKSRQFNPKFQVQSKREGKQPSAIIPLTVVYVLAVAFAMVLNEGPFKTGLSISSGNPAFDRTFFGPGMPSFTGSADTDRLITTFLRGSLIFVAGGILPLFTYLVQKIVDNTRMSIYFAFWGTTIGTVFLYYLVKDYTAPLFQQLVNMF